MSAPKGLARPIRREDQGSLFEREPDWKAHWWGMPSFEMGDARPLYAITVNFFTVTDLLEFGQRLGIALTTSTDSLWFPVEKIDRPNEWVYVDET